VKRIAWSAVFRLLETEDWNEPVGIWSSCACRAVVYWEVITCLLVPGLAYLLGCKQTRHRQALIISINRNSRRDSSCRNITVRLVLSTTWSNQRRKSIKHQQNKDLQRGLNHTLGNNGNGRRQQQCLYQFHSKLSDSFFWNPNTEQDTHPPG